MLPTKHLFILKLIFKSKNALKNHHKNPTQTLKNKFTNETLSLP